MSRNRLLALLLGPLVAASVLVPAAPASATAGVVTTSMSVPSTLVVGQKGVTGSITIRNDSDAGESIHLRSVVMQVDVSAAVGAAGSGCAGATFTRSGGNLVADSTVILTAGQACTINLTFRVLAMPNDDRGDMSGVQIQVVALPYATLIGSDASINRSAGAALLVINVLPAFTATVSPGGLVGSSISASVKLNFTPTGGSLSFLFFESNDPNCANPFTMSYQVTAPGTHDSTVVTPAGFGQYRWIVAYSGDAGMQPFTTACNDPGMTSTISRHATVLTAQAEGGGLPRSFLTDTATISGGSSPTGTVTFRAYGPDDTNCGRQAAFTDVVSVDGNGTYTSSYFSAASLGVYRWVAEYSGDGLNESAVTVCGAPGQSGTIAKRTQIIEFISTAPTDRVVGSPTYQAAAAAWSLLPVTLDLDPTTTNSACTISPSGVVSFDHVGSCVVRASQSGTSDYYPATPVTQTIAVGKGTQTIALTGQAPTNPAFGQTYQATATSSAGLPVTYSAGTGNACTVTSTGLVTFNHAGTCTIRANQPGSTDYNAATQATRTITVPKADQTVAFTSVPPSYADIGGTFPVAATGGASSNPVTFTTAAPSICTVTGSVVTFTGSGQCVIRANQAGNTDYDAAPQVTQAIKVRKTQEVRITSKPTLMSTLGGTYRVTTTATSGLAVTLTISPATTNGACTITGTTVTLVRSGTCAITADQAGNNDWAPAPQATQTFAVTRSY